MSKRLSTSVNLWQEFRKYLRIEWEISKPEIATKGRYAGSDGTKGIEVTHLKVTFINTASEDPGLPRIVFIGVGLGFVPITYKGEDRPIWARIDVKIQQPDHWAGLRPRIAWPGESKEFPETTGDEEKHGFILFPGELATIELTIPTSDITDYEFFVMGNVSQRHFFHYQEKLDIS